MTQPIATISAVIVSFHPDPKVLGELVEKLLPDTHHIWLIHNSPQAPGGQWPAAVRHIQCEGNIGVAGALNQGFELAYEHGADAVIGFDQDSVPMPGLVARLRRTYNAMQLQQPAMRLAAIGPATQDIDNGHLLQTFAPYNWLRQRLFPVPGQCHVVDHLITSGCMISRHAWQNIGPTNPDLFIDWVDVEWSGRARQAGYQLIMDSDAILPHRIGQTARSIAGRRFHVHSPFRHYFVLRNAILILQDKRFDLGWRTHHLLYALRVILANLIFAPDRLQRLAYAIRGLKDGLAKRTGPQGQVPN